jgi:hypothetical protein
VSATAAAGPAIVGVTGGFVVVVVGVSTGFATVVVRVVGFRVGAAVGRFEGNVRAFGFAIDTLTVYNAFFVPLGNSVIVAIGA